MPGIVFVNPSAGSELTAQDLAGHFPGHEIVECPGDEIPDRVKAAAGRQPDFVGVAGGDGTLRGAAQQLLGTGVPFLPIPGGTRNHFALAVGVEDLDAAGRAASGGTPQPIDVGDVNGHCFLNNSSVGLYPKLVVRRESYERRMSKRRAQLAAAWEQIRHGHRFRLRLDHQWHRAWLVFVGNGCYGEHLLDFTDRESVGGNVLDVRLVLADRPLARTRVVFALLRGLDTSPLIVRDTCPSAELGLATATVDVALDGEVERLDTPLRYSVRRGELSVLVPPSSGLSSSPPSNVAGSS
ncbi:MAG TPA: diacylglycerol kinase family protein [Acidimicrobiia bacterium]|nr:diacylglycerol kinase family protein [Acidimicrobiia bacterium]